MPDPATLEAEATAAAHAAREEALRRGVDPDVAAEKAAAAVRCVVTPDMTVAEAATAERRRLRAIGRVEEVDVRPDGRVLVYVNRERGRSFYVVAADDDPNTICNAVDSALRPRIERDRMAERGHVDQLRRRARQAEEEADRHRVRDGELERQFGGHDWRLPGAERRLERVDRQLYEEAV